MTHYGRCDHLEKIQGAEWKLKCNRTATYWSEQLGWRCDYHYRHCGPLESTFADKSGKEVLVKFENKADKKAWKTERRRTGSKANRYK